MGYGWYEWRPYVPAAQRRRRAEREMRKLRKGQAMSPVVIEGRKIARTFWGKAWCDNLERYSDYANRLPRGRSYVRNDSVLDLQVAPGEVQSLVSGTHVYQVAVRVSAVPKRRWTAICRDCAGAIDSLVELLQGRFSTAVMERICQEKVGLFPAPAEMRFSCSCPDWASMCKHVAAVLYGIGARLDQQPELLFTLRKVDEQDLIAKAGGALPLSRQTPAADKVLDSQGLSELFGLEIAAADNAGTADRAEAAARGVRRRSATTDNADERRVRASAAPRKARARRKPGAQAEKKPAGPVRTGRRVKPVKKGRRVKRSRRRWPPGKAKLDAMIAEATVDANDESEQRMGFYTMIEESLALPFETEVLGAQTTVERIDLTTADEIVAVCRRGRKRQRISILELPLPNQRPAGAEWIEAYRRWAGSV